MKGKLFLLIILLGVCFLFTKKEEEIRIRVMSHSERQVDIYYKEDVVEYLKTEIFLPET